MLEVDCLAVWILWHNLWRLFHAKSIFTQIISSILKIQFSMGTQFNCQKTFLFQDIRFSQTVLFQAIQFSISIVFVHTQLNVKTVLFQTIQFSISTQISSIWPRDKTLSGATILGQSGPGSDGNGGVLRIPQSSRITGTSSSDCVVS